MYLPKAITLAAVFGELQRAAFLKPEKGQGALQNSVFLCGSERRRHMRRASTRRRYLRWVDLSLGSANGKSQAPFTG